MLTLLGGLLCAAPAPARCQVPEPAVYTVRFPSLEEHLASVEASLPTGGQRTVEVMMPVWSPGYYRVEDHAAQVQDLSARDPDGRALMVQRVPPNRWRIETGRATRVVLSYRLVCTRYFVTTNWVSPELGVLNGPATFITRVGDGRRPQEVYVELPPSWPRMATGLPAAPDGRAHHYRAEDYDALVDAPIVAGDLDLHEFDVAGVPHYLVDAGAPEGWNGAKVAGDLKRIVQQTLPLWGDLPYPKYVFLNVFWRGGGGLEHRSSTLLTTNPDRVGTRRGYDTWLGFAAHEYVHALNVKRLRPVELGPFDYETPPQTASLWMAEGVTSYLANQALVRAGLVDTDDFLASLSGTIRQLQNAPGRLLQTLEQSSLEVWNNSNSGVGAAPTTVSYYVKGEVVGFLLDARVRAATGGRASLDDVVRRAYALYGGPRGYTPEELRASAAQVAGADLEDWFHQALASTEELSYGEALDWFGLRFADGGSWALMVRHDATPDQTAHLQALVRGTGGPDPSLYRPVHSPRGAAVEQTRQGDGPAPRLVERFDGLGFGFSGPQGPSAGRNPSDNSLAVGPDHIVQIVNTRLAVFSRKGERFDTTGRALYGAVPTNTVFKGFGGQCEAINNGDAVVRYDQLADRWLLVMPLFRRGPTRPDQPPFWKPSPSAYLSPPGVAGQPGPAAPLHVPPPPQPADTTAPARAREGRAPQTREAEAQGPYGMCYAVSQGPDPLGSWYRYEFLRPLFPDYPRPALWPDGYYVPTSTGDEVVEKHACVVERARMLAGEPAREQCFVVADVGFLNNTDLDGRRPPPEGAPNIVLATGATQLRGIFEDDGLYTWRFHVDWADPARSTLSGPDRLAVAPYHYLCDGQLTNCVRQPGTDRHLDAQGDKLMARVVYRNLGARESIVAVHSVDTEAGGGGVRWYELTVDSARALHVRQQGTFAPDALYRWMGSPAMDALGNIGIGYSFGGTPHFAGQRFAGRRAGDPLGRLTLREAVLVEGEGAQTNTLRWEDYTQTAVDPRDDCTIWYVGDYLKAGAERYSTRIGAFRLPGCGEGR